MTSVGGEFLASLAAIQYAAAAARQIRLPGPVIVAFPRHGGGRQRQTRCRHWRIRHNGLQYQSLRAKSRVRRFFAGRLPDLNLGTADGASCAPAVQNCAALVLAGASDFSSVVNGRFKGGYVTRHYGAPSRGVHALQLETAQACYMDEAPPYPWDPARAARLGSLLRSLAEALVAIRPAP